MNEGKDVEGHAGMLLDSRCLDSFQSVNEVKSCEFSRGLQVRRLLEGAENTAHRLRVAPGFPNAAETG